MNILFLDVETLGLEPSEKTGITQLAYIITDEKGNELKKYDSYIYHDESFKETIDNFEYNSVRYENCATGKPISEVFEQLFKDIKDYQVGIFAAYNVTFDLKFVEYFATEHQGFRLNGLHHHCVMKEFSKVLEERKWRSLVSAFYYFNEYQFNAHNAVEDVKAAKDVHFKLKKNRGRIKQNIQIITAFKANIKRENNIPFRCKKDSCIDKETLKDPLIQLFDTKLPTLIIVEACFKCANCDKEYYSLSNQELEKYNELLMNKE